MVCMLSEIKRYQDDKSILKQYIEGDQVYDDGKLYKAQPEAVPPLSDNHQPMTRPVIRLQEKNIILTRINPLIRDTSVLVRLRPAWEDLRSYLIARGRKRFEVSILLKLMPKLSFIGLKKSLLNVFHDGSCHPGMAVVIDDRLKVWDEKDQSRVHVVPAFTPYYAPQAEANCSIPVLCVARNVACNVRGGFFKDFDEGLLPRINNVLYEDEINDIPSAPDVGNYLITEEENAAIVNGNKDPLPFDGMADAEVERRMKEASGNVQSLHPTSANLVMPVAPAQNFVSSSVAPLAPPLGIVPPPFNQPVVQPVFSDPLQGSPAREEGEVPESELDPDTRRRLLILQHGQDTRDPTPPLPVAPPAQVPVPPAQPHGSWFPTEDGMNPSNLNRGSAGFSLDSDTMLYEKKQPPHPSFFQGGDNTMSSDRFSYQNQRFPSQLPHTEDHRILQNHATPKFRPFSGMFYCPLLSFNVYILILEGGTCEELAARHVPSSQRNNQIGSGRGLAQHAGTSVGTLEDIALKCGSKVEYRSLLCDTAELQFSIEVWIVGEKVGEGIGRTRKAALCQASEISLRNLANKYLSSDPNKMTDMRENGFGSNHSHFGYSGNIRDDLLPVSCTSEESRFMKLEENNSRKTGGPVAALKELCTVEGYNLVFQAPPNGSVGKESYAQVEVGGQIFGKGVGMTWEEAKLQAADEALGTLRSMLGQLGQKRSGSPRIADVVKD
ncbi:hypothetical protein PR202_gb09181 [Eleusine coracana subsp. coracana]|uniref:DRBM domain-containing protein n=1 Tax=Eleusine coracana subsp. coracana TaxID=191504 RepID=A0AAV5EGA3_ELECO|nr:hypothetical protein PR202_gb09181 [Eleusine coracana subsp. coracana]